MQYLEITAKVELPDNHREASMIVSRVHEELSDAEGNIREVVSGFEFTTKTRRKMPDRTAAETVVHS